VAFLVFPITSIKFVLLHDTAIKFSATWPWHDWISHYLDERCDLKSTGNSKILLSLSISLAMLPHLRAMAATLDTRIFTNGSAAAGIYRNPNSGQLEISPNATLSAGSLYWTLGSGIPYNESRGVIEFPLSGFNPLPGTSVRLDMKDVGGGGLGMVTTGTHKISWYAGDGVATVDDWGRAATNFATVTTPDRQTFETIPIGVTSAAVSFAQTGADYIAFRFEPDSASSFEDFGRASSFNQNIVASMVVSDDPVDIFHNPSGIDVTSDPNSPDILIQYEPRNSLGQAVPLSVLADSLGVESFNWISRVTHFPQSWKRTEIWLDVDIAYDPAEQGDIQQVYWDGDNYRHKLDDTDVIAFPVMEGMVDLPPKEPSHSSSLFNYLTDGGKWYFWDNRESETGLPHDEFDYYYGIAGAPTSFGEVEFRDRPLQPVGAFLAGEFIEWETELVGVRPDGTPIPSGLKVSWKSNALRTGQGGVFQGGGLNKNAVYLSGGVFDVQIVSIPEPCGFGLLILGVLISALTRRPKTNGHH
jgi:hypothetical protein